MQWGARANYLLRVMNPNRRYAALVLVYDGSQPEKVEFLIS